MTTKARGFECSVSYRRWLLVGVVSVRWRSWAIEIAVDWTETNIVMLRCRFGPVTAGVDFAWRPALLL